MQHTKLSSSQKNAVTWEFLIAEITHDYRKEKKERVRMLMHHAHTPAFLPPGVYNTITPIDLAVKTLLFHKAGV